MRVLQHLLQGASFLQTRGQGEPAPAIQLARLRTSQRASFYTGTVCFYAPEVYCVCTFAATGGSASGGAAAVVVAAATAPVASSRPRRSVVFNGFSITAGERCKRIASLTLASVVKRL